MTTLEKNKQKAEQTITSKDNPLYRKLKQLLTAKGIKEHKLFFLMGDKLIKEFIRAKNKKFKVHLVVVSEKYFVKYPFNTIKVSQDLFNELDPLGTHHPLLVLECDDFETIDLSKEACGVQVILPLGDPRNLGALVRSAAGFGIQKIVLTQEACHPFLPNSVKASAGAVLTADFYTVLQKINAIPITGENFALDLKGKAINTVKWPANFRLWIGEEGPGLQLTPSQKNKMNLITIPTTSIESLNATVSASIAFWEINRK